MLPALTKARSARSPDRSRCSASAGRSSSCARPSGARRFEDFQRNLGIARNVLTDRLGRLVDEGILRREQYQERPARFEYRLTDKGLALWPVMMTMMQWGDRYYADPDGPPLVVHHRDCGGAVTDHLTCTKCGAELGPRDVVAEPGPGARAAA